MQEVAEQGMDQERLLQTLTGEACTFCGTGEFSRGLYKGNDAVVCDECGVPGAQIW